MISIIILAIAQALTEFIPVSSSGHLFAIQELSSLTSSLALDVALHFGTLLAMILYFRRRIVAVCGDIKGNRRLIANIVITSIPAAFAGYLFADFFADDARNLGVVITMLVLVGILMIFSDKLFASKKDGGKIESLNRVDAALIGIGQALALIPGTSRSGATMLAARARGYSNAVAAEYSFLAGIPVIAGASLKIALESETQQVLRDNITEVGVGILISFVVGYSVLRFLIKYISKNGLSLFGWYRLALAAILFIIWVN